MFLKEWIERFYGRMKEAYFSFDKDTKKLIKKLGYIPEGCYCTTEPGVFIPEHAKKNRQIVIKEVDRLKHEQN
jgi:hypothetical protein